jgi:CHASE2 domain-containing sensor protein
MKVLSDNEAWAAFVLFGAFAISALMFATGWVPMWVPWIVWILFVLLLVRSQMRKRDRPRADT